MNSFEMLLLGCSGLLAIAYFFKLDDQQSLFRSFVKTASMALLAMIVAIKDGPLLLVAALALSAIGDAFLSRNGEKNFVFGLASFLVGHVCYGILFYQIGQGEFSEFLMPIVALLVLSTGVGMLLVKNAGELAVPVAAYVIVICAMAITSLTVGGLTVIGVLMFVASDTILGIEKFVLSNGSPLRLLTSKAIWALYYWGQVVIMFGVLSHMIAQ